MLSYFTRDCGTAFLGVFNSHNDVYDERDTQTQAMHKLLNYRFNDNFKSYVFRPKQ